MSNLLYGAIGFFKVLGLIEVLLITLLFVSVPFFAVAHCFGSVAHGDLLYVCTVAHDLGSDLLLVGLFMVFFGVGSSAGGGASRWGASAGGA